MLTALSTSMHAEDLVEGISYAYPNFYNDEDTSKIDTPVKSPKIEPPHAWEGKIGNAEVTVDVKEPDPGADFKSQWEKMNKQEKPKKKNSSRFHNDREKEEEKEQGSGFEIHFKW